MNVKKFIRAMGLQSGGLSSGIAEVDAAWGTYGTGPRPRPWQDDDDPCG